MTNKRKYPIGTKIRFIHDVDGDYGKIGTVVAYHNNSPTVYIPTATKHIQDNRHPTLSDGTKFTWYAGWGSIEKLKNEQLQFDFMYK